MNYKTQKIYVKYGNPLDTYLHFDIFKSGCDI